MDKFLEFFVDHIGTLIFSVFIAGAVWFLIAIGNASSEARERTRERTAACYSQGLVLVETDAGQRCADPRTLVKVK